MIEIAQITTADTRAQAAPVNSASPTRATSAPNTRWIQPHVVRSN